MLLHVRMHVQDFAIVIGVPFFLPLALVKFNCICSFWYLSVLNGLENLSFDVLLIQCFDRSVRCNLIDF
jgi:hypothetical protein